MLTDLDLRVSVDATEGDPMNITLIRTAEGRSASAAELKAKILDAVVGRQQDFTR